MTFIENLRLLPSILSAPTSTISRQGVYMSERSFKRLIPFQVKHFFGCNFLSNFLSNLDAKSA